MERRADDERITKLVEDQAHLHGCVELLKVEMQKNTEVTEQIRDILASFRVVGALAKWTAGVGAAVVAVYHGLDWLRK